MFKDSLADFVVDTENVQKALKSLQSKQTRLGKKEFKY